jgi:signal peptidase II
VRVLYLSAAVILLDQASKLFVKGFSLPILGIRKGMTVGSTVPILGDALRLTYIENPGMAFGIDVGSQLILTIFSFLASTGVFYYLYRIREEAVVVRMSLALIFGGAVGNLIDRIFYGVLYGEASLFYGKVVDFLDVNLLHLSHFGIFNVADAAVTCGVLMLLIFHRNSPEVMEPSSSAQSLHNQQHKEETPGKNRDGELAPPGTSAKDMEK